MSLVDDAEMGSPAVGLAESEASALVQTIVAGWQESGRPDTIKALECFPQLRLDKSCTLDLVYEEYVQRTTAGEAVDAEEYCARFPEYRASILHLIEAHQFLERQASLAELTPFRWPEPGERLANYTILRRLGRGSFARVYLAREEVTERQVVLKVSPPDLFEPRTLGRLEHVNVIPVYHAEVVEGRMLVVTMPFVGASTLEDLIELAGRATHRSDGILADAVARRRHPDDAVVGSAPDAEVLRRPFSDAVVHIAHGMAEGLAYLHREGVNHRDLKPSNVLLSWQGRPVIVDFNLAVDVRRGASQFGGTLQYMAPEQIRAALGEEGAPPIDHRADLYSFGVILFELLTGRHPFAPASERTVSARGLARRDFAIALLAMQRAGCRVGGQIASGVDPRLEQLVRQCLEYDPRKRPASARALADELATLCRHDPAHVRRLRRVKQSLVAVACLLVLGAAGQSYRVTARTPVVIRPAELAKTHLKLGQPARVVEDLNPLLTQDAIRPEEFFLRGLAHLRLGNAPWALQDFERARQQGHDPNGATSAGLAYCYAITKNLPAAVQLANEAIDHGFDSPAMLNNRAAFRLLSPNDRDHDLQAIMIDLEAALNREKGLVQVYYNRSIVFDRMAQPKKDQACLGRAIDEVRDAEARGLASLMLYRYGASLMMKRKQALSDDDFETIVRWLKRAISLGYNPSRLEMANEFKAIEDRPAFGALRQLEPGQEDKDYNPQLVDPLGHMFR